jgi:hypothetical protein
MAVQAEHLRMQDVTLCRLSDSLRPVDMILV